LEIHVYIDSKTILKHVSMSESEKFAELNIYNPAARTLTVAFVIKN